MNPSDKLLVTGASGLLGWKALSYFLTEFDVRGTYLNHEIGGISSLLDRCDIRDHNEVSQYLKKTQPLIIIHCAARTEIDAAEKDREACYKINVEALKPFLDFSAKNSTHFVHVSTDAFFSLREGMQATEDMEPTPLNYYSETKLEAEKLVQNADIRSTIIRTNIFGWNLQDKTCLSEWIVDGLVRGEARNLFEDVLFSPILTSRLVRAFGEIIRSKTYGLYNIAGTASASKFEFGLKLAEVFGLSSESIYKSMLKDSPLKAKRSHNMALDSSKFYSQFPALSATLTDDLIEYRNEMIYFEWPAKESLASLQTFYSR